MLKLVVALSPLWEKRATLSPDHLSRLFHPLSLTPSSSTTLSSKITSPSFLDNRQSLSTVLVIGKLLLRCVRSLQPYLSFAGRSDRHRTANQPAQLSQHQPSFASTSAYSPSLDSRFFRFYCSNTADPGACLASPVDSSSKTHTVSPAQTTIIGRLNLSTIYSKTQDLFSKFLEARHGSATEPRGARPYGQETTHRS